MLERVRNFLQRFGARHQALKLFVLGALAALGLPPLDAAWLLIVIVPLAFAVLAQGKDDSWLRILWHGWIFGLGYFVVALHWIGFAFLVDPSRDLWMMPIALGGLAAIMSAFWAVAILAGSLLARRYPIWLTIPIAFGIVEWLRGHLFTGFPWAVFGQMTDGMGGVDQLASLIGMTGLTLMVWLWAGTFYALITERRRAIAAIILATLPIAFAWGQWRLASHPTQYRDGIMLRLVQPNISQNDKWRQGNARNIYNQLLALTRAPSSTGQPVTHIIWPESSVPFLIDESAEGRAELANALQPGQTLIAGAVRRSAPNDQADYFTSILILNDKAEVQDHYDKWHLVPGGEFLPLAWLLEPLGLRKVVDLPESFRAGPGPANLMVPNIGLAGMSICYEAIFPGAITASEPRADWLVNVTNDGWFGKSTGPYQHLAQLRLRTIELGLPAARDANTGISAIIDAYGRETFTSPLETAGAFDMLLPKAAPSTLYGRFGDLALFLLLLGATIIAYFYERLAR